MAKAPLLDLDTLIERPFIRIDKADYELRNPDELSIFESHELTRLGRKIEEVAREKGESDELAEAIDAVVRKVVVDLPPDVFAKLSGVQRMAIVEVFTGLLTRRKAGVAGAVMRAILMVESLLTGANTFPGSSDFTGERRPNGSATHRPQS